VPTPDPNVIKSQEKTMTPLQNDSRQHPGAIQQTKMLRCARARSELGFGFCSTNAAEIKYRIYLWSTRIDFTSKCGRMHHDGGTIVDIGPAEFRPVYKQNNHREPLIVGAVCEPTSFVNLCSTCFPNVSEIRFRAHRMCPKRVQNVAPPQAQVTKSQAK
jgi:hypothetical protein